MSSLMKDLKHVLSTILWVTALLGIPPSFWAEDLNKAEQLYVGVSYKF